MRSVFTRSLCLAALFLGFWSARAGAETLHGRYGVTLLGIPLGQASLDGEVAGQSYKISINARLTGIASLVSSSRDGPCGSPCRGAV